VTQLVVFAGAPLTRARRIHSQLVAWRDRLEHFGMALVPDVRADAWDRIILDVRTTLLSSESAGRSLRTTDHVEKLRTLARDNGVTCRVVLVVREQLDHLNAMYCSRVLDMEVYKDFDSFVIKAVGSGRYDLAEELGALLDAPEVELVAVPYSRLDRDVPARTILLAAGLSPETLDSLPGPADGELTAEDERTPGPVLVAATRLMHKRMSRLGLVHQRDADDLVAAAAQVRRRADEHGWDDTDYWGWSPDLAAEAVERFRAGNAEFARRAWGGEWLDAPAMRDHTKLDLASQRPEVVSDVMTTIQRVVDAMLAGGGSGEDSDREA